MQPVKLLSFSIITSLLLMSFKPLPFQLPEYRLENTGRSLAAKATWAKDTHDFGEIARGVPVTVEFEVTNTGDAALVIGNVTTSCGCTASDYTKEPIAPGKSSKIKVSYNAANAGAFSKSISVNSNGQEAVKVLLIKGVVK